MLAAKGLTEKCRVAIGLSFVLGGYIVFLPWGPGGITMQKSIDKNITDISHGDGGGHGCPYDWCLHEPKLPLVQYIIGFAFVTCFYSWAYNSSVVLYTKLIGPHPKGRYMAWLDFGMSLGKMVAPVIATTLFEYAGLRGMVICIMSCYFLVSLLFAIRWKKIKPYHEMHTTYNTFEEL